MVKFCTLPGFDPLKRLEETEEAMDLFVARQPILDRRLNVFGYELLFRSGSSDAFSPLDKVGGDRATASVIDSVLLIGFDKLTGEKPAFINFTANLLHREVATIFPRHKIVIEILEDVQPDEETIAACRKLKNLGYMLAIDDFVYKPELEEFYSLADIIKVDFKATAPDIRAEMAKKFSKGRAKLLAEKVETAEDFRQAMELGYSYFQGYFFSKPVMVRTKDVQGDRTRYLRLLREVSRPDVDLVDIEKIIKSDISLAYRLLKYINSAAFGFRSEIRSVRHALVLLGLQEISKWLSLAVLRNLGKGGPTELLKLTIVRARFGELLALEGSRGICPSEFFLVGLLSTIDAFIDQPLPEILAGLSLAPEIHDALMGVPNILRRVLDLVIAYEQAQWEQVSSIAASLDMNESRIPDLYLEALKWAEQALVIA